MDCVLESGVCVEVQVDGAGWESLNPKLASVGILLDYVHKGGGGARPATRFHSSVGGEAGG
jgi:hypothetical protein